MSSTKLVKIDPSDAIGAGEDMTWLTDGVLNIVVVGASGDLAKKKTFPSLLNLFDDNLLPQKTAIWGYARSDLTDDDLRDRLRPFLEKSGDHSAQVIEEFLSIVRYQSGNGYGDIEAFSTLSNSILVNEQESSGMKQYNRMFYFAIPPNVFADTAVAINQTCMQDPSKGFSRVIVEKPFGRDTESFEELNKEISEQFSEEHLYRIDRKLYECARLICCNHCVDSLSTVHHPNRLSWKRHGSESYSPSFLQHLVRALLEVGRYSVRHAYLQGRLWYPRTWWIL